MATINGNKIEKIDNVNAQEFSITDTDGLVVFTALLVELLRIAVVVNCEAAAAPPPVMMDRPHANKGDSSTPIIETVNNVPAPNAKGAANALMNLSITGI